MAWLNRQLAMCVKRLRGWDEVVWEPNVQYSADVARRDLHFQLERRFCQTEAGWCGRSDAIGTSDELRMAFGQTEAPGLRTGAARCRRWGARRELASSANVGKLAWESLLYWMAAQSRL